MRRGDNANNQGLFESSVWERDANGARDIASAYEACDVLARWSQHSSSAACDAAIVAARSASRGTKPASEARKAFVAFAADTGLLLTK